MVYTLPEFLAYLETPEYREETRKRAEAAFQKQMKKEAEEDAYYEHLASLLMSGPSGV